ncbi:hypothetical protein [Salinactinospora qingdaonensis]|uniref:Uncharacterized protein n=1 Tax=Salinactinospora qingdaonensis TaxID=702744 RepID=A0ABP7FMU7_9ACTN
MNPDSGAPAGRTPMSADDAATLRRREARWNWRAEKRRAEMTARSDASVNPISWESEEQSTDGAPEQPEPAPAAAADEPAPEPADTAQHSERDEQAATTAPSATSAAEEAPAAVEPGAPLVEPVAAERLRRRWRELQGEFVDDPTASVHDADQLVEEVVEAVIATLGERHHNVQRRWQDGAPDTEELRLTLRDYRSLLHRMLGDATS